MSEPPSISIVVPTQDRPIRLRWLLNALGEQTVSRARFEVVVANGSRGSETGALLAQHELTGAGVVRELRTGQDSLPRQRDRGWRATRAPLVLFTDDDCRPPSDWVERALELAERYPGAIVQGATLPDPDEAEVMQHSPYARSQRIVPPTVWAQTCNILYPRAALELVDGFDLEMPANFAGDDTDLALRAIEAGVEYVGAPTMLTYHAVLDGTILTRLRSGWRWGDLPYVVKRHPRLRDELPMWVFWKRTHALLPLAAAGLLLLPRTRLALALLVPWAAQAAPDHSSGPRGRIRSTLELPSRGLFDAVEMVALARGSIRHRSLLL